MTEHAQTLTSPDFLSEAVRRHIDVELKKFPSSQKKSAVMAALMIAQRDNGGYLTEPLMDAVAAYLGMPRIAVYEVATFYNLYDLAPVGRHKISVCGSISCMLRGSDDTLKYLEQKLGIQIGQTTQDGKFTLKRVECLASCGTAPMMIIDNIYYENLTIEKIDQILDGLE